MATVPTDPAGVLAFLKNLGGGSAKNVQTLRCLAEDGNEEAANRLAELAAERGDVEELRPLVDEGNEVAEDRLSRLIREAK